MNTCPNCGARLSCGCQRKTASDGKQGCNQCIPSYEKKLGKESTGTTPVPGLQNAGIPNVTVSITK